MRFATLLRTGSIVKGPITVKLARETNAPEKTTFPQIRGITYYKINPVILWGIMQADYLENGKSVWPCFCPGSVAVAIFTMCLEAPFSNKESENTTANNHSK